MTTQPVNTSQSAHLFDVHHHVVPPQYVEALHKLGIQTAGGGAFPTSDVAQSLQMMDRNGIQTAILSLSSPGVYFGDAGFARDMARQCNDYTAGFVASQPERLGFFAVLPLPDVEASLREITYALDTLHADGIGLMSNFGGVYPGDPAFDAVFAELDKRKAVVFIHPTISIGAAIPPGPTAGSPIAEIPPFLLEFVFDTTRAVTNLLMSGTLKKYPGIRYILSHAGGTVPFMAHKMAKISTLMRLSTALKSMSHDELNRAVNDDHALLANLYYDTALSANAGTFPSLLALAPTQHIMLGTDYPWAPESETIDNLAGINGYTGFTENDRIGILQTNAHVLFPRFQSQLV